MTLQPTPLPGVLHGLHYQCAPAAQGRLVRVARGRAWDEAGLAPG